MIEVDEQVYAIEKSILRSVKERKTFHSPYEHWFLSNVLPSEEVSRLQSIQFPEKNLDGVSGTREIHNKTRNYLDENNQEQFTVFQRVAEAFQSQEIVDFLSKQFGAKLDGTYLRIEFAEDIDGFYLVPHTDIGVKNFTMLFYLSDNPQHSSLGTDVYDAEQNWVSSMPFIPNHAMVFVPSDITYHGFEKRCIQGVRKSLVINYVTPDWRAREQLAFPNELIRV